MRLAVVDWNATNVATLEEADQKSVKEIFEAKIKEFGENPPCEEEDEEAQQQQQQQQHGADRPRYQARD